MLSDRAASSVRPAPARSAAGRYFRQLGAVIRWEALAEWRSRETPVAMVVFALLVLLIFSFAFDLRPGTPPDVLSGVLWSAILFAGMVGLGRGPAADRERGTLDGLLLAPVDRSALFLARLIGNLLLMVVMEVVALPTAALLFNLPLGRPVLLLTVLLGTLGFATVGTLFATIAANSRARDVLLPVLLLPVSVPVVIAAVAETAAALAGPTLLPSHPWDRVLIGYTALFLILGMLLYEYVLEE